MATKVEELREELERDIRTESGKPIYGDVADDIDFLIAAAKEEGCEDGWAATRMLWTRMQKWNEEWQKENPQERSLTLLDAMDLIEWKLTKAHAEGAGQERKRLCVLQDGSPDIEAISRALDDAFAERTPPSVLAPKEKL